MDGWRDRLNRIRLPARTEGASAWMGLLALLVLGWGVTGFGAEPGGERRPNLLLVVVDTLRRDHCSAYGYDRPTTPFLEQLAAEGVRFDNHFSGGPWTTPSLATLFTGRSAVAHGLDSVKKRLPDNIPTLAERLRASGYYTLGVLCNPCAGGRLGFSRGFDRYDDFTIMLDLEMNLFGGTQVARRVQDGVTGPLVTRLFLKHMEGRPRDKPWFAFVLYFDPHYPYEPGEAYRRIFSDRPPAPLAAEADWLPESAALAEAVARYDAEIRQADDEIAGMVARLREAGHFSDDDLLVWTADHGEEFRDHGGLRHGKGYFDELVRAPLVLRWPGKLPAGKTVEAMTAHEDLGAALLAAAGVPLRGNGNTLASADAWPTPLADLLALARGDSAAGREGLGLGGDVGGTLVAWRTDAWLLTRNGAGGAVRAWNLADDPRQTQPLDPTDHPESRRLAETLETWRRKETVDRSPSEATTAPTLTAREKAALKALGYLQD